MDMEMWFSEIHTANIKLSVRVERHLFSGRSDYQRIDVFESKELGRFLACDGNIMFAEADEFVYSEMITHVPMAVHPHVRRVLIIGGGDGGVAREFSHYDEIERIDLVEPDRMYLEVCQEYFPDMTAVFDDPRVHIYHQDGLKFLRRCSDEYDIIINDAMDPLGYNEGLFTREFYGACYQALHDDGIMVYQHGSPFYDEDESAFRTMHRKVYRSFPISRVYQANIPTCPAGYWMFGFASKRYHPINDFDGDRWQARGIKTWYYSKYIHTGSFMLPQYVVDLLKEEEGRKPVEAEDTD